MEYQNKTTQINGRTSAAQRSSNAVQLQDNRQQKPNATGLPDNLKSGIENLSGHSMNDVKVHYNSAQPAQLNAHAYAQGTHIHLAPGQEKHLPHEAWHVVQQKQGRVKPTMQMKGKVNVNDDAGLEKEADVMGSKAMQLSSDNNTATVSKSPSNVTIQKKGRIDTSKIVAPPVAEEKDGEADIPNPVDHVKLKQETEKEIEALRVKRKQDKIDATSVWAKSPGKDDSRDKDYNDRITAIRKEYEEGIKAINEKLKTAGINDAYISGDDYYGTSHGKIFKRPDNGKEYVKDKRGTFIPRHVRRELNQKDDISKDITPTGFSTYGQIKKSKGQNIDGLDEAANISWPHREFFQQSRGGGGNQFAFSHTSTKRPILSNDHKSFGTHPNGAILSDLSKLETDHVAAQWEIDPVTGHKVPISEGKHETLGDAVKFKQRDEKVRLSGYRNMEVVTSSIPKDAIVKKPADAGWGGHEWHGEYKMPSPVLSKEEAENENNQSAIDDYAAGTSRRGQEMVKARQELEK